MRAHRLVNKVMPFEQLFIAVNGTPNKPDECTNQNSEALYILIINTMTVTQNQSNMRFTRCDIKYFFVDPSQQLGIPLAAQIQENTME
ncbi:hypothetical protein XFHB_00220 [Xylella fastidiosa]|uniref:Uncharacterized protein n=1 Tax=Xylella fastidiosa TaxID=2371 RepID=A0ABC8AAW2_XYLFS|nr:hypothetical protein [Xylella fastidiosa]ALR05543.1 hypothetical protein XFHB_00220 [Xylella fastidiosa]